MDDLAEDVAMQIADVKNDTIEVKAQLQRVEILLQQVHEYLTVERDVR